MNLQKADFSSANHFSEEEFFARQDIFINRSNLATKKIAIIGAGGLGSAFGFALASVGLARLCVVDFDDLELSNLARQIMFCKDDINKPKVLAFKKLSQRSNSQIELLNATAAKFLPRAKEFDLLIDATDNISAREQISQAAASAQIPWLFTSVEGWSFCAALCDDKKAPFSAERAGAKPQTPPVVMLAASFAACLALRYLAGLEIKRNELYYANALSCSIERFFL